MNKQLKKEELDGEWILKFQPAGESKVLSWDLFFKGDVITYNDKNNLFGRYTLKDLNGEARINFSGANFHTNAVMLFEGIVVNAFAMGGTYLYSEILHEGDKQVGIKNISGVWSLTRKVTPK